MSNREKILPELNEVLFNYNPKGGRPMQQMQLLFKNDDPGAINLQTVRPYTEQRFHFGYCTCGKRLIISFEQAQKLACVFHKKGVKKPTKSLKFRLIKRVLSIVDKEDLTDIIS